MRSHAVEHLAQLESYRAEHLDDHAVEFIETEPGVSTAEPAFKYGLEDRMAQSIGAIDRDALATEQAAEIFDSLSLADPSWALRRGAVDLTDCLTVANVGSVSERCDDQALLASEILPAER